MVDGERVLPSAETGTPTLELLALGALGEPSELLLLVECCVTSSTKKLWRPTSQLKVAVAAYMALARHDDKVQCYTHTTVTSLAAKRRMAQNHQLHSSCAAKHGQGGTCYLMHCNDALQTH